MTPGGVHAIADTGKGLATKGLHISFITRRIDFGLLTHEQRFRKSLSVPFPGYRRGRGIGGIAAKVRSISR